MKINDDCIRDVLLYLEKNLIISEELEFKHIDLDSLVEALTDYPRQDIFYSVYNLNDIGFINAMIQYGDGHVYSCLITNINYEGHEFIKNIRDNNIWNKTKSIADKLGSNSLEALFKISSNIITELIKNEFQL